MYEDAAIKKILSPYPADRSVVTDCAKPASSGFPGQRTILIYGFEDPHRPLSCSFEAFEAVASRTAVLGPRQAAPLRELVHPVFSAGQDYPLGSAPKRSPRLLKRLMGFGSH
jgi:hypothetical protein